MRDTKIKLDFYYSSTILNRTNPDSCTAGEHKVGAMSDTEIFKGEVGNDWDPANFDGIINQFQPRIFRFIYSLVGEAELASDLTQDTFLSAYRHLIRRREINQNSGLPIQSPTDNMSAWLYAIARNIALSEIRRHKVVRFFSFRQKSDVNQPENDFDSLADTPALEPGGSLENRSVLTDELERAIKLVGRQKLTALLLHVDGFSYREICEITGDSLSSVKSQIFRAKESLRKALILQSTSNKLFGNEAEEQL
ncbi:MAG: RNA polymerase sigma factor [Chloroflexi bacterium]|uniref:RNA polymerase sigma factor n=1 Tax=Candidatus Chlorohelix allophototropha TaxID=3003348 RepID=A0A8T7LSR1_9CHLR|nr:RNA polymerase sigma factor [Chloroflexota bacterium]WJW66948.1 RNA polymerase sigma factor [Chloroflexota bacterium L227-S17]